MTDLLLFPISGVLVPRGRMPLQIFEQRYLDLVRTSMKTDEGFGVVWIRRGSEVVQRGKASPDLGDYGTVARIVDWDQLPNGLLGITVEGGEVFDLEDTHTQTNGLLLGEVRLREKPESAAVQPRWQPMVDVLHSLETHPHVQRMNLTIDYTNAWEIGFHLVQLLPLEEFVKYELLGSADIESLMAELDIILNQISG